MISVVGSTSHPREDPLSGIVVAILIVVWAVVLVPMWAHRYSPADSDLSPHARVIRRVSRQSAQRRTARAAASPAAAAAGTLRRRRRTLAALAAAALVAVLGTLAGVLPSALTLLAVVALAGYLGWLRYTVLAGTGRGAGRRGVPGSGSSSTSHARSVGSAGSRSSRAADAAVASRQDAGQERSAAASASAGGYGLGESTAAVGGEPWTPVSVPLPSYVTAPPAPRVVLGDWHEEDLTEGELPGETSAYALGADQTHPRAVGD